MSPPKNPDTEKNSRHVPAFHVKQGPVDIPACVRNLRQIRHGLEDHSDPSAKAIMEARNHVDSAIIHLRTHISATTEDTENGDNGQHDIPKNSAKVPRSHKNLQTTTAL